MKTIPIISERSCGDCKACCEGWLHAEIYGHKMYRGKPCHFINDSGCSIYENRPSEPCKNYKCLWLSNTDIPGWLKPNKCGVILTMRSIDGIKYIEAIEMGVKMDSSVLSWLFTTYANHGFNVSYTVDGGCNWIGSREFINAMEKK